MLVIVHDIAEQKWEVETLDELFTLIDETENHLSWGEDLEVGTDTEKHAILITVRDHTGGMGEDL